MSQSIDGARKTYLAAEAGAVNSRWYISDASTSPKTISLAGATQPAVGYNEAAVLAAGDRVTLTLVNKEGTVKAIANGAITGGNNVYAAADGEVASSGSVIEGVAQETVTADGDIIEVLPVVREVEGVANTAGVGITGTATAWATSVEKSGGIVKTTMLIDLTGLNSGGAADDIIGADGAGVAHLGQITAAVNGTIVAGQLTCLETPAGGDDDIDVHSATEATGVEDTAISALTETKLCNSGDLTAGSVVALVAPAANQYLYLTGGTGDKDATYTAGILLLEFWGTA